MKTNANAVVDGAGKVWIKSDSSGEGVTSLYRGFGATVERKFVVFGTETLRPATAAEWARYVDSI